MAETRDGNERKIFSRLFVRFNWQQCCVCWVSDCLFVKNIFKEFIFFLPCSIIMQSESKILSHLHENWMRRSFSSTSDCFFSSVPSFSFRVQRALSLFHIITSFSCTQQQKNEKIVDNRENLFACLGFWGKRREERKGWETETYRANLNTYTCSCIKTWFIKRHDQPLWGRAFFICFGCTLTSTVASFCKFCCCLHFYCL